MLEITTKTHPFVRTKEDFLLKGAPAELVILIGRWRSRAESEYIMRSRFQDWLEENRQAPPPASLLLEMVRTELKSSSPDFTAAFEAAQGMLEEKPRA